MRNKRESTIDRGHSQGEKATRKAGEKCLEGKQSRKWLPVQKNWAHELQAGAVTKKDIGGSEGVRVTVNLGTITIVKALIGETRRGGIWFGKKRWRGQFGNRVGRLGQESGCPNG